MQGQAFRIQTFRVSGHMKRRSASRSAHGATQGQNMGTSARTSSASHCLYFQWCAMKVWYEMDPHRHIRMGLPKIQNITQINRDL